MLYYAIRLDALPLQIIVTDDRFSVCQDAVVLARESAFRAPDVRQVTLHLYAFVLRNVLPATSHDDLEFEIANVFDGEVLFADDLAKERMRAAWENKVMLFAEECFQLVKLLRYWLVIASCQQRGFDQNAVEASLRYENLLGWTFDAELS